MKRELNCCKHALLKTKPSCCHTPHFGFGLRPGISRSRPVQMELCSIARLESTGSRNTPHLSVEARRRAVDADHRQWASARKAHPAAERSDTAAPRPAIACRCVSYASNRSAIWRTRHHVQKLICRDVHACPLCAAYTNLQVDIDSIRDDNEKRMDAQRKNGLIIWSGRERLTRFQSCFVEHVDYSAARLQFEVCHKTVRV